MGEKSRTDPAAIAPVDSSPRQTQADAPLADPANGASTPAAGPRHRPGTHPAAAAGHPLPSGPDDYARRFRKRFRRLVEATDPREAGGDAAGSDVAGSDTAGSDTAGSVAVGSPEVAASDTAASPDADAARRAERRRGWLRSAVIIAIVVGAALVLRAFVVGHYYIPSASMEPTLHGCPGCNDDHVAVDKVSYRAHGPRPGDIVVFDRPPGDISPEHELIKRVIAVGGDTVALRSGQVYVDGRILVEPYVNKKCGPRPTRPLTAVAQWRIPHGDVFVLGDNRCNSHDSRAFGPIRNSSIVGRAFAIIWPLNRIRLL
ncbi:MAG TPA: signal peptidase I [Jatrophihabitans sp.]|nr:signal peptidase I [Jatrophihabitans sp.]